MLVPFLSTPDKPLISPSQSLVPIADIKDGIVVYKDGGAALIMLSSSLNFGLLSEMEQNAVMASYAGLLNSFKFPIQIVIRSQKKDIANYMDYLGKAMQKVKNQNLLNLMKGYKEFVEESVKKRNILSKTFYIIIPFSPFELGLGKSTASTFRFGKKEKPLPFPKSYVTRKARITLYPKRDHLISQSQRMGIHLRQLSDEEIIGLFYDIYNPVPPAKEEREDFSI